MQISAPCDAEDFRMRVIAAVRWNRTVLYKCYNGSSSVAIGDAVAEAGMFRHLYFDPFWLVWRRCVSVFKCFAFQNRVSRER